MRFLTQDLIIDLALFKWGLTEPFLIFRRLSIEEQRQYVLDHGWDIENMLSEWHK